MSARVLVSGRVAPTGRVAIQRALDPRDVPALMAGGIWLPGEGYTAFGGDDHAWASQATQANSFKDDEDGYKPKPEYASNGQPIYRMSPDPGETATASWIIASPGSALQWTQKGSYAGWFKANTSDTSIHYFFRQWPGGASNNRVLLHKNNDANRIVVYTSYAGSAVDGVSPPDIGGRAKWNNAANPGEGVLFDWTQWHFVRVSYDMSLTNYWKNPPTNSAPYSDRLKVYVDETLVYDNADYSAPSPTLGGSPTDGPIRGIYASTAAFVLGADGHSSQWNGHIGPFYIANSDSAAAITDAEWARIMLFRRPA